MFIKIKNKIKSLFSKKHIAPYITKQLWDKQYSTGAWDYLESDQEREHYLVIIDFLFKYNNAGSVLDIGCGTGLLYNYLKSHNEYDTSNIRYYGVDISEQAIKRAKHIYGDKFFDFCNYEKSGVSGMFDTIIFNETLYYFSDTLATLDKCIRENLKQGGKLIISMVEYDRHYTIWDEISQYYNILDEKDVVNEEGTKWTVKVIGLRTDGI